VITRDIRHPQMKFNRFIYYILFGITKQTCFNKEETLQKSIDWKRYWDFIIDVTSWQSKILRA